MTMSKKYFQKYYQDHKKEYNKRRKKWCKKNPEKAIAIRKRYREKFLGKRKPAINKTDYSRVTSLKESFIKRYCNDLRNKKDDITHRKHKGKIICVDCLDYRTRRCPGWDKCEYKEEILEEIKRKGGKNNGE